MTQLSLFDLDVLILPTLSEIVEADDFECEHVPMLTGFCNFAHCLRCGMPLDEDDEGCYTLFPAFLQLEYNRMDEIDFAEILDLAEPHLPKVNYQRRTLRQWFAPPWVAKAMKALADIYCESDKRDTPDVLEPSCGAGMLLAVYASPRAGRLVGLDIQPQSNWQDLEPYGIEFYDTSAWGWLGSLEFNRQRAAEIRVPALYDVILCHPPFGAGISGSDKGTGLTKRIRQWSRTQSHLRAAFTGDVYSIFIGHFLRFLKPGGVMVCLTPSGWWYQKTFEQMRYFFIDDQSGYGFVAGVDFGKLNLWKDAIVHCALSVFRAGPPPETTIFVDASKMRNPESLSSFLLTNFKKQPFQAQ